MGITRSFLVIKIFISRNTFLALYISLLAFQLAYQYLRRTSYSNICIWHKLSANYFLSLMILPSDFLRTIIHFVLSMILYWGPNNCSVLLPFLTHTLKLIDIISDQNSVIGISNVGYCFLKQFEFHRLQRSACLKIASEYMLKDTTCILQHTSFNSYFSA